MKEKTDKLITWIGLGISLICVVLTVIFAMGNGGVKDLSAVKQGGLWDTTYFILLAFIAIAICAILIFAVVRLAAKFKEEPGYAKKFFLIVGIIVVVCAVSFLLSKGNDVTPALMEKHNTSEQTSKLIGAACWVVYITVIGAVVSILYVEIAKLFKK